MIEYTNTKVAEIINNHIHSEIYRAILKRRLIDGVTYDQLSEEFHYSVRQVKNIVYKYEKVIFRYVI